MLNVIEYGKESYDFPALIVLGCFDAIHVGHRELLKKAKLQAKINGLDLGVMIFKEGKSGKLVSSFEERLAILEQYNVKFVVAIDYNEEFKSISAIDFLHALEDQINVKAYMSGKDFRFGAQAKGKSSTLKNYAEDEENGVWYMPVKDVVLNGEKVSTTLIKSCLEDGNVVKANELLGSEFSLTGEVVHGEGRGTSVVGFPTLNIEYPEWKYPLKHGVYSVKCIVDDTDYQGIANFGTCPTFNDSRIALEVYLEGFSGDLYGRILTVRFVDFIREIEEFSSVEALSEQLNADLQMANEELVVTEPTEESAEETVAADTRVSETVVEEQTAVETVDEVTEQSAEEVIEEVSVDEVAEWSDGFDEMFEEVVEDIPVEVEEEQYLEAVEVQPVEEGIDDSLTEELIEVQHVEEADENVEEVMEEVTEQPVEEESTEKVVEEENYGFNEAIEDVIEEDTQEVVCDEDKTPEEQPVADNVEEQTFEDFEEEQPVEPTEQVTVQEEITKEQIEETIEADECNKTEGGE